MLLVFAVDLSHYPFVGFGLMLSFEFYRNFYRTVRLNNAKRKVTQVYLASLLDGPNTAKTHKNMNLYQSENCQIFSLSRVSANEGLTKKFRVD